MQTIIRTTCSRNIRVHSPLEKILEHLRSRTNANRHRACENIILKVCNLDLFPVGNRCRYGGIERISNNVYHAQVGPIPDALCRCEHLFWNRISLTKLESMHTIRIFSHRHRLLSGPARPTRSASPTTAFARPAFGARVPRQAP